MKVAYISAGAAGMYCGSCIHDNTLAVALRRLGHDVVLVPTYTPLRTDETDVSEKRVFYGAINVYLQLKSGIFRHTPRALDWILDRRPLLRWVSRFAGSTDAHELGELTLAVLQGEHGPQRKELERLVGWLAHLQPDVVHITNSLFLGMAARLRDTLRVPVVMSLQGEDLFVDDLPEPYRERVLAEMRDRAGDVDLFLAPSRYYEGLMAGRLGVSREAIAVAPLGINLEGCGPGERAEDGPLSIGYLARICPEKGLHVLLEAFRQLVAATGFEDVQLRIAGYLGARDEEYLAALLRQVESWGLSDRVRYVGEVDRAGKIAFLQSLDLFALPTVYREAKGLPALEAMANAVPVVLPDHGSFPEMVEATGGGVLFEPESTEALGHTLSTLLANRERRRDLGRRAYDAVHTSFSDNAMAQTTADAYRRVIGS